MFRDAICRERESLENEEKGCLYTKKVTLLEEYKSKINGQFNKVSNGLRRV